MSAHSGHHHQRDISHNLFGNHTSICQGDHYHLPHPPAPAEIIRVIPYPRNEDLVHRRDLIDRLNQLLPRTQGFHSAALWGLGGSGKTQIALDYGYRRCDADNECCVFWVHADSEATFLADYKTIGKKLGVDEQLDGTDLLDAVRNRIEARPKWLMILDNADDLRLFGVGQAKREEINEDLYKYIPRASQGTILWTSRDAHIAGTLVGACRGVEVRSMATDEATTLLAVARGDSSTSEEAGVDALLQKLQCLPLAISQAGAYMRRTSMTAEQYLALLRQGKTRWEVLKVSDADRHRRPEVSNSVLETWRISTERIRAESEISYRILHVIAYVDSQNIPHELVMAAASRCHFNGNNSTEQATEFEVLEAIARLKEYSFLRLRHREDGAQSYEMHKLVQEAVRYGLGVRGLMETTAGNAPGAVNEQEISEAYYSGVALQIVDGLFPPSDRTSWTRCEQYMTHAIQVGEWAEVSGTEVITATLLKRVSYFLYKQGRWREKEPVDKRAWGLRRQVLGEKHPDTITSIVDLAVTYHAQGRYEEAEGIYREALNLRQEELGETHPDTISSMAYLATTYHAQGRYDEAKGIYQEVLELRREVLGDKHPDTITSIADLAVTYHTQGRYKEAEGIYREALNLRQEELGETHPDTISSMAYLATTYHAQGRYDESEKLKNKVLDFRGEALGEQHPDTIRSMADLATTYHEQGRYDESEKLKNKVLDFRGEVLGENHPDTIRSIAELAATYRAQGRYNEAEETAVKVLNLRREVLRETHPDTVWSMASLTATYRAQGRYNEAEETAIKVLNLRREVLGQKHPDTIWSIAELATTYHEQGRYGESEELKHKVLDLRDEVLGGKHPDTIRSIAELAAMYHAQGRYGEAEDIYQEALCLQQEVLGEKHPDTIRSMADLATTYHAQGRYDDAEKLKHKVLDFRGAVFGEKHPDTIRSIAELAATYHAQGRYNKAKGLHQTALELRWHILGERHPDTMQSMAYLASTREALQQLPFLVKPAQSLAVKQIHESQGEGKLRDRSLREVIHGKIGFFRKWRSHKSKGFD